jgi:hypothetical protein
VSPNLADKTVGRLELEWGMRLFMPAGKHQLADKLIRQKFNLERSPAWPKVEKTFEAAHPKCVVCGATRQLNVHHKFPFHYVVLCGRPDLELDLRNLMTLCVQQDNEHHVLLGHLGDYESYNPQVVECAKAYSGKSSRQIRTDAAWQQAHAAKPKHFDDMTAAERVAFRKKLDRKFKPAPAVVAKAVKARAKLNP